ncbi:hypothetical protein [Cupriavidus oxalaticus]|uniref:hypothetical protein n=1 Tax=Cupriavidus oxalaticus TaxID=96344 RepID=UPI003174790B
MKLIMGASLASTNDDYLFHFVTKSVRSRTNEGDLARDRRCDKGLRAIRRFCNEEAQEAYMDMRRNNFPPGATMQSMNAGWFFDTVPARTAPVANAVSITKIHR